MGFVHGVAYGVSIGVVVLTIAGVAVGRLPYLHMNRATIALAGATFLILLGAISLEQAYTALDPDTLTLLFAMMIVNTDLRRAGFFELAASWAVKRAASPWQLLALIIVAVGVLSALFVNDTIVLVFTPLVIDICLAVDQKPVPYLVALATAANIGSAAMITGNPQNMIIGVASGISYIRFTLYLGIVSLAGLAIVWFVIVWVYRRQFGAGHFAHRAHIHVQTERPLLNKSLIATGLMLVAFAAGMPIPLAALSAATLLLISRRIEPEAVFREVDWSLLVFFAGLFIVTGSLETLGVSKHLFAVMQPIAERGIAPLSLMAVILSNLISNVPAVLLFRPFVPSFSAPLPTWLTLAMATTLAGNLTLLGSVANLIVAESAGRRGVFLTFQEYLRAGVLITVFSVTIGVLWLTWLF